MDSYKLVMMDIQMPVMDGLTATGLIRDSGNMVPIVALTADAISDWKDNYMERGFNGYLTKPILPEKLEGEVRRLVGKN